MSGLKVHVGSVDKRLERGLERNILELYKRILAEKDLEVKNRNSHIGMLMIDIMREVLRSK